MDRLKGKAREGLADVISMHEVLTNQILLRDFPMAQLKFPVIVLTQLREVYCGLQCTNSTESHNSITSVAVP